MELKNIVLSKVSQAQNVKSHMFFLICGSYTYKINVHINTYIILFAYTKYIYAYMYGENENMILVVDLRGLWGGKRGKENVRG
jgi:hypothetical protein